MCFAFVIDPFQPDDRLLAARHAHIRTMLVVGALRMALGVRGPGACLQLVHHSDQGSPVRDFYYTQTLTDHRVLQSVGSVGDA